MKRPHVLIVDDDAWLVDEYTRTLKAAGYTVSSASNALQAMGELGSKVPDCIVLDLFMPGPNGLVLLHELQSHADLARVPVVLVSNAADSLTLDSLRPYGVMQMLNKTTMQPGDVLAAVKKVLP